MNQPPLLTLLHLNLTAARNGQGRGGLDEENLLQQRWQLIGGDWTTVVRGKKLRNKKCAIISSIHYGTWGDVWKHLPVLSG